jgi:hypothetical protein
VDQGGGVAESVIVVGDRVHRRADGPDGVMGRVVALVRPTPWRAVLVRWADRPDEDAEEYPRALVRVQRERPRG